MLAFVEAQNETVRGIVDGIFDEPVCAAIFGKKNLCGFSGGVPLWCKMLLPMVNMVLDALAETKETADPALMKYLEKLQPRG